MDFYILLIDGWKGGKKRIENLLNEMNAQGDGFRFSRDYLIRTAFALVNTDINLRNQSLIEKAISDIRTNWDSITTSLESLSKILSKIGLSHETLTSYNATIPIAYYLCKGGKIEDDVSKMEVKKFLFAASANRLFEAADNNALNNVINVLNSIKCKSTPFSLSLFKEVILNDGRNFAVTKEDVEYWLEHYEKGPETYILLSLLYPYLILCQDSFHQDNCHPCFEFDKNIRALKLSSEKQADWQRKKNLLPNLQFLEGSERENINRTSLLDFIALGNDFSFHPAGISLKFRDFGMFFEARRVLLKKELFRIFDLEYDKTDESNDKARMLNLLGQGECMSDNVLIIIKELAKGASRGAGRMGPYITEKISEKRECTIYNCRYLLIQVLRHYKVDEDHRHISVAAKVLWDKLTKENFRESEYNEKIDCDAIREGVSIKVDIYKGNSKTPKEIKWLQSKDKFQFNDVFTADHMVPISSIAQKLIDHAECLTDDYVLEQLDKIHICTILKSEDRLLPSSKREESFEKVKDGTYHNAGIELG